MFIFYSAKLKELPEYQGIEQQAREPIIKIIIIITIIILIIIIIIIIITLFKSLVVVAEHE